MATHPSDTVPRISRCPECSLLVLYAWSGGAAVSTDVNTLPAGAAHLGLLSGQTVYRVRSTRRPTLELVADADQIIDHRAYLLEHACTASA